MTALLQHPLNKAAALLLKDKPEFQALYRLPVLSLAAAGLTQEPEDEEAWELLGLMSEAPGVAMDRLEPLQAVTLGELRNNPRELTDLLIETLMPANPED